MAGLCCTLASGAVSAAKAAWRSSDVVIGSPSLSVAPAVHTVNVEIIKKHASIFRQGLLLIVITSR
jgi:hypothetical protein